MKHLLMNSVLIYASLLKANTSIHHHVYLLTWQQVQHHQGLPTPQDEEWCPLCLSSGFWVDQQSEESNSDFTVSHYSFRSKTLALSSSDQKITYNKLNMRSYLFGSCLVTRRKYIPAHKATILCQGCNKHSAVSCEVYSWAHCLIRQCDYQKYIHTTVLEFLLLHKEIPIREDRGIRVTRAQ